MCRSEKLFKPFKWAIIGICAFMIIYAFITLLIGIFVIKNKGKSGTTTDTPTTDAPESAANRFLWYAIALVLNLMVYGLGIFAAFLEHKCLMLTFAIVMIFWWFLYIFFGFIVHWALLFIGVVLNVTLAVLAWFVWFWLRARDNDKEKSGNG